MKDLKNKLEQLNLSPNEASIYLSLLKIGQTSAGKIISDTRLHRSVVYDALEKLIDRKLIFKFDKKKIAYFQATSPEQILKDIKKQEILAKTILPELKKLIDTNLPEIKIYEGLESWRQFWLESAEKLPVGSTDYVAGSIGERWQKMMGKQVQKFLDIRLKRKIKWKMVIFDRDDLELELLKKYPKLHEYRLIEKNISKQGNFNIFNNDTLILHSATEPIIIEIKNAALVKVFRDLFDVLWDFGKKV